MALPLVSCVTLGQSLNLSETQYFHAGGSVAINPPAMQETGSIPGLGRSPGKGHGNPLQYSFLENPHGQRSLVGYNPWGCQESDMTERLSTERIFKSHTSNSLYPTLVNSGTEKCLYFPGSHYLGERR